MREVTALGLVAAYTKEAFFDLRLVRDSGGDAVLSLILSSGSSSICRSGLPGFSSKFIRQPNPLSPT